MVESENGSDDNRHSPADGPITDKVMKRDDKGAATPVPAGEGRVLPADFGKFKKYLLERFSPPGQRPR